MRLTDKKWIATLLLLGIAISIPSFADGVGKVIRLNQTATVLRDGKTIPLDVKDEIYLNDVIQTDKTGKVQVFFKDDSTVTIGKNSKAHMKEFVPDGTEPRFKLDMTEGAARIITGKIVEKNPNGFTVATPDATIAIRGTILAIHSTDGKTSVFVENTLKQVFVNDILVPSGFKLHLSPGGNAAPEQMTDKDREQIDAASTIASNGGNAANTTTTAANTQPAGQNTLGNSPLAIQAAADNESRIINLASTTPSETSRVTPVTPSLNPSHGKVAGLLNFSSNNHSFSIGTFSFYVDLTNGSVNQARMHADNGCGTSFMLDNGHGTLGTITNFITTASTGSNTYSGATMTFDKTTPPKVLEPLNGTFNIKINQGGDIGGSAVGTRIE